MRLTLDEELRVLLGRLYDVPLPTLVLRDVLWRLYELRVLLASRLYVLRELLTPVPRFTADEVLLPLRRITSSALPLRAADERTALVPETPVRLVTTRTDELRPDTASPRVAEEF